MRADRETKPKHASRVGGIYDAVVPKPCAGIERLALTLILLAYRRLNRGLFLFAQFAASRLEQVVVTDTIPLREAAQKFEFEKAARLRDLIKALKEKEMKVL